MLTCLCARPAPAGGCTSAIDCSAFECGWQCKQHEAEPECCGWNRETDRCERGGFTSGFEMLFKKGGGACTDPRVLKKQYDEVHLWRHCAGWPGVHGYSG